MLGGFAAPLFLWLAGLAVVLSAEKTFQRTGNRREAAAAICRRGLEIFVLAFLFRLQAFIVSPGSSPVTLFRVDILNIMGPAIVVAGLVWSLADDAAAAMVAYAALAVAMAMLTPIIRAAAWVNALPVWVQWYVRPVGEDTTFTFFPWCGFVFASGAAGVLIARVRDAAAERRVQIAIAASGALITALGFYTASRPTIYRESSFWTSSPTYFAVRVGIMMLALSGMYLIEMLLRRWDIRLTPLERFGRGSLFVYWIHVELVYGYATWPLRRHLSLWEMAIAYLLFCWAMYRALALRDRLVEAWRTRHPAGEPAQTAPI